MLAKLALSLRSSILSLSGRDYKYAPPWPASDGISWLKQITMASGTTFSYGANKHILSISIRKKDLKQVFT